MSQSKYIQAHKLKTIDKKNHTDCEYKLKDKTRELLENNKGKFSLFNWTILK